MEQQSQEAWRIARLRELLILDSEPEPVFDSIVALAAEVCGTPIALVSLVDAERQWFKARVGLPGVDETPRELVSLARADGTLVFVNAAYARHFGKTPEYLVGLNLFDFVEAWDRDLVAHQVALVMAGAESQSNESRMLAFDGHERWVAWTNRLQRDGQGQALLHSVGRDITERRIAERTLRELNEITDNTTDFVVQTDRVGNLAYLNPAGRAAMGMAPGQRLTGLNFLAFLSDQVRQEFAAVVIPAVRTLGVWTGESTIQVAGGRDMPVSIIVIAHRDADGAIARYSSMMRDISGQQEAGLQLMRQAATLRSVAETIPASIVVVGSDQRYRFVNTAFERWVGMAREDIIGRDVAQVMGALDYERSLPWMQRVLAGESVQFERNYEARSSASHISSVARMGGDEFAILLTDLRHAENALAVAAKVIAAAHEPFEVAGQLLTIGASVGVAFGVDSVAGWPDLVARADARLYEAKHAGRGRQVGATGRFVG